MNATDSLDAVLAALRRVTIRPGRPEAVLQAAVADALRAAGIPATHEYVLGPRDRVDFLAAHGIAIECKAAGRTPDVIAQVTRYAVHAVVTAVVLITTRLRHARLPRTVAGKPARLIVLHGLP